ncbi:MAG: Fic family protein, partial [Spirochaetota bacterium]
MLYIWERDDWPNFHWQEQKISPISRKIYYILGTLDAHAGILQADESLEKEMDALLQNILYSFAIEGEILNVHSVRSSLAKRLNMEISRDLATAKTDGLAELQMDVLRNSQQKLTLKRLYRWHKWIFIGSGQDIPIGKWRGKEPMQVVSGRLDAPKVHFEAPPYNQIHVEMRKLLSWFQQTKNHLDPFVRAGIVHLWFLTLHPFADGNGRLARNLSELALAQDNAKCAKLYSLSSVILKKRKEYYQILEKTQKGNMDITSWLQWFLFCIEQSIANSLLQIERIVFKTRFWKKFSMVVFKKEQKKVLNALLQVETEQFVDGISARQYQKIANVSKATATRHLVELVTIGCLT